MVESLFTLEMQGIDKILNSFRSIFGDIDKSHFLIEAMAIIGKEVEAKAKDILNEKIYNTPEGTYLRTGLLRARTTSDTPKTKSGEVSVQVKSTQEYAIYVELGTSKMKARAFLLPAGQQKANEALEILMKALTKYLESKKAN